MHVRDDTSSAAGCRARGGSTHAGAVKKELHPENVAHSARLEFDLHPFVDRRVQRCVQNFFYTEHLPTKVKEGDETDSGNEVEYIAPCYIDIEFETTGGVSRGLLDGHEFNSETTELFAYMYNLTRAASTKLRTVKIRVDVDPHDVPRLTGFLEALGDVSTLIAHTVENSGSFLGSRNLVLLSTKPGARRW
ncbi:uncharacterized protein BDW43DRAFT_311212 [Aspergillus alliaceus]|uniref:uncharacterized protein n=1 Tax=Petromyces alliaceus TaxID=209559 RepID=UPI0012A4C2EA|nr:uncharacterized protein BDW43DRAFT_311212 [Aspergillus alliaceus]KAB8233499.1 hypothetical protein BDW43DRAFT_311212 [Aspergillus alliaceus]